MTTDWIAAAAEEIERTWYNGLRTDTVTESAAIIRRHYADANAGRQAAVDRLVDAAESLRAEVATIVNDPDQTDLPGLEDAYCRTIEALDAVRSMPAQDAPDISDELATALKHARELVVTYMNSAPASRTILEAVESDIRTVLRRYDDSRKEHA